MPLANKDLKAAVISIFQEIKITMCKEFKEGMITMPHQIVNNNKEMDIVWKKKNQTKILEFKNTVNKIKNLPERFNSIFKLAEI